MNTNPRSNEGSQPDIFKSHPIPSRGFISELLTLISQPIVFFTELGSRQSTPHTLWLAIVILLVMTLTTLQAPSSVDQGGSDFGGSPFEELPGGGSAPFDPGFPMDNGGGIDTGTSETDPTERWTLVLTTIAKQIAQWGALTVVLSLVTLLNGYIPPFAKNLEVAIWASLPLALMAGLQLAFMTGGGTISAHGLSGFLDEWDTVANLNLHLQSVIHALSEQLTLFWLWSLGLLYIGMRYTLRGKIPVVLFTLVMWVVLFTLVSSLRSYGVLTDALPIIEESIMPQDMFPDELIPGDDMPAMDIPLAQDAVGEPDMVIDEATMLPEGA